MHKLNKTEKGDMCNFDKREIAFNSKVYPAEQLFMYRYKFIMSWSNLPLRYDWGVRVYQKSLRPSR